MTKSMVAERRAQLEEYLQNVSVNPDVTSSDVYISFFRKLQQDTFKIQTQPAFLDIYLADGTYLRTDIQTSDTTERVLMVISNKIELSRELIGYFSLFLIQDHSDGQLSVLKKLAEFELPYVSLQSTKELACKIGIRKWYMDPLLDKMLMDCRTSVNLLYMQAVQELEKNWIRPTEEQMQKLQMLQKTSNKSKFLELAQKVPHYGYIQLTPCPCDYPEVGCTASLHVGNNEISCCIKLPGNQIKEVSFKINRVRCWQVTLLAFLLSSCLKKMISEQLMTTTKDNQEMVELPESDSSRKASIHPSQVGIIFRPVMSYVFVNDSTQTNVPLLQACIDGDFNYSKRLLESGFDPNIRDSRGRTGLHLAAARGNVDIAQLLHKFGGDLLATDYQGNTALHLCGHVDTIQFLVSNGLKIDICNHQGATPLVLAKRRGVNKDVIRLLESLEEQEVKGFNRGAHSKLETMQTAESESAMESHSLLNPNLQQGEGVLSSFRTTWQEFVEDLGFWRVLLLLVVIALLSLGIAYYVSGVLPFVENQPELLH